MKQQFHVLFVTIVLRIGQSSRFSRWKIGQDFHYDVVSVDEKFVVKLHLGAHVVGGQCRGRPPA